MEIFITGHSGFVGKNFIQKTLNKYNFNLYNDSLEINSDVVLHLAGKAHDLKKISDIKEYYNTNTELTKSVYNAFLTSKAKVFITLSSVKAVADEIDFELTEDTIANPKTHYGISKLLAEQYILSKDIPDGKRVFILRPCMIHGPGNKGNLNLLYKLVSKGFPWPLGSFDNKRSYCSFENLCYIIEELIECQNIPSGIYNVADDLPLSTNEIINLISYSNGGKSRILKVNKSVIIALSKLGSILGLQFNIENLKKLTETYIVSNLKIKKVIRKPLPLSSKDGLIKTFHLFSINQNL